MTTDWVPLSIRGNEVAEKLYRDTQAAWAAALIDRESAQAALATARETNARLNRRVQAYEAAMQERIEKRGPEYRTFGRMLANGAAEMYRHHAEVMREALENLLNGIDADDHEHLLSPTLDAARDAAREALAHAPGLDHLKAKPSFDELASSYLARLRANGADACLLDAATRAIEEVREAERASETKEGA